VRGLQPHTQYAFRVRATSDAGAGDWSGAAVFATAAMAPSPPRGLSAVAPAAGCLDVAWRPPAADNGEWSNVDTWFMYLVQKVAAAKAVSPLRRRPAAWTWPGALLRPTMVSETQRDFDFKCLEYSRRTGSQLTGRGLAAARGRQR